jgi:hypothetical protein
MINIGDLPMWKYIFIGDSANPMYFMMHYLNVVLSVLILVSVPKMRFADWIYCNFFAATYYGYVGICMVSLNVTDHVSGLNLNDWDLGGEYSGVAEIFKVGPAAAAAIGFSLSYLCISGIIWGQSCLQKFKRYRWYDMWNKKTWYFGWYLLTPTEIKEPKSLLYRLKKILIHGFRK